MFDERNCTSTREDRDASGRRSRLYPQSTGKRITLQERDWLWLNKIHEHGPLASSFLLGFAKDKGASEKRAKERLTDLFNEANTPQGGPYLARPPQQFATIDSRYNQLVYDLAPAGVKALKERGFWRETNAARSGPWLHNFMASSITASIELAALGRDDLSYIPAHAILERAGAALSCPVSIIDPYTNRTLAKTLQPDALFGLEYKTAAGSRYRFFAVEADRSTEPMTTSNLNRKSLIRNFLQYRDYVAGGRYKEHLKLTSPLLVLSVFSDERRLDRAISVVEGACGPANYMLFQAWEEFATPFRLPSPNVKLLEGAWRRAGAVPVRIGTP